MAHSTKKSLSRSAYLGGAAGMTGAAAAWVAIQGLTSLGPIISSYGALDLVVLALLGAGVGGLVGAAGASLRAEPMARPIGLGLLLGSAGAAVGGLLAFLVATPIGLERSAAGFAVTRIVVWVLAGAGLGAGVAASIALGGPARVRRSSLGGAIGGLVGAGLVSISGPAAVWQLVGFLVVGVAVGYGCLAAVPGSLVIEWAPVGPPGGLWRHREWEVEDRRPAVVADQVRIESVGGQGRIVPSGGGGAVVTLRDQVIRTATPLQPGDRVRIGEQEYLVRRTGGNE